MKSQSFRELDLMLEMAESFEGFYVYDAIFNNDTLVLLLKAGPKEAY